MVEASKGSDAEDRSRALALLGRARGLTAELQASNMRLMAEGFDPRLAAILATLRSAEIQLEQLVESPGSSGMQTALSGLEELLVGGEFAAANALQSGSTLPAAAERLAATTAATRRMVQQISDDMFRRRIFDPYLHFASPEEEAEFRRREAERQQQIERLNATGRPADALRAGELVRDQLHDAGRHGAERSPDYAPTLRRIDRQLERMRETLGAWRGDEGRTIAAENAAINHVSDAMPRPVHGREPHRPGESVETSQIRPVNRESRSLVGAQFTPQAGTTSAVMAGVDLASLGIAAAPVDAPEGHGLPDQARPADRSQPPPLASR